MSREDILDLIAPPVEVPLKFVSWVESTCEEHSPQIENLGDAVKVVTNVACAEELLNIKVVTYQHKESGMYLNVSESTVSLIVCKSGVKVFRRHLDGDLPTIPENLLPHLEFVSGISQLPVMRKAKEAPATPQTTASYDYVIPATNRVLYNIPAGNIW